MAQVSEIAVLDAAAVSRDVATLTAIADLIGAITDGKVIDPDGASASLLPLLRGILNGIRIIDPATGDHITYVDMVATFGNAADGAAGSDIATASHTAFFKRISQHLTTVIGHVDGLEAAIAATNSLLTSQSGYQDTLEAGLASILAKIIAAPATEAKQDTTNAEIIRMGTRTYGAIQRVAVAAASAQSTAITATEVLLHASTKCYVLAGASPTAAATTSIPLEAGEKFHQRITSGHKIAVIRDALDGFLHIAAVA